MRAIPKLLSAAVTAALAFSAAAQQSAGSSASGMSGSDQRPAATSATSGAAGQSSTSQGATSRQSSGAAATGAATGQPSTGSQAGGQQSGMMVAPVTGEMLVIQGTVESIDRDKRMVTVKGEDGRTVAMRVGQGVRNFDNLKKGDQVTARFSEAFALAIAEGSDSDIRTRVEADAARQAAPGGKPGMQAMERVTLVANVFEVDRQAGLVTLRGTSGDPFQVRVQDKQLLQKLDKGDQVVASVVQAAAVSIEAGSKGGAGKSASGATSSPTSGGATTGTAGSGGAGGSSLPSTGGQSGTR